MNGSAGQRRVGVFLDRDGTIIEDRHYLADPAGVRLMPGAARAIGRLNRAGLPVLVVTNQSGIGRGYFDESAFERVSSRIDRLLEAEGAVLDATYFCPHAPDRSPACDCRKPRAGLFERAARDHGVDLERSFYIGDRLRDLLPGVQRGGFGFLIPGQDRQPEQIPPGVRQVDGIERAVKAVLQHLGVD